MWQKFMSYHLNAAKYKSDRTSCIILNCSTWDVRNETQTLTEYPESRFKVVKNVSSFLIGSQRERSWGLEISPTWQKRNTRTKRSNQNFSSAPRMHLPIQTVITLNIQTHKKTIPLQVWTGPEGSMRLRHPNFKTIGTWEW